MNGQKINEQVEVFFFRKLATGVHEFLLMKRVPEKGGFWQPLTGGVEVGESRDEAIAREGREETGIQTILQVINTEYQFSFDDHGKSYVEFVYGAEVSSSETVILSREHNEYRWVDKDTAMALLKWPNNKEGLRKLCNKLMA